MHFNQKTNNNKQWATDVGIRLIVSGIYFVSKLHCWLYTVLVPPTFSELRSTTPPICHLEVEVAIRDEISEVL